MTSVHGSTKDKNSSTDAKHDGVHASSSEQAAQKLAADAKGDPQQLALILGSLPTNAQHQVAAAAQKMYGNGIVTAALSALSARLTEAPKDVGGKFAADGTVGHTSPGGSQQRTDGTHGVGGNPTMFGGDKDNDAKGANPLITAAKQDRYGGTFGTERLGDPVMGSDPIVGQRDICSA